MGGASRRRPPVLSLQGGIGNQLFQWAWLRAVTSAGHQVDVDVVRCRGDRPLAIAELLAGTRRISRVTGLALVAAQKAGLLRPPLATVITEQGFGYDDAIADRLVPGGYVLGYFQSYRYFDKVADVVRDQVGGFLRQHLTATGAALADELRADPSSVALHVRRGDYVSNPTAAAHHGVLPLEYYRRAAEALAASGRTRRIWFSDDLPWVEANLAGPGDVLCPAGVAHDAAGEIALMAACNGRVIANSSFSWWAGWLGDPATPVVAPSAWFAGTSSSVDDLLPPAWLRI